MADSSGNSVVSIKSWSMTTDVSSSPFVSFSVIESLVDYCIEVCTKTPGIDPRCSGGFLRKRCSEDEPPRPNGSQLRNRRPITRHDDGSAGLDFAKHSSGLISQLSLVNDSAHGLKVAHVAHCRKHAKRA